MIFLCSTVFGTSARKLKDCGSFPVVFVRQLTPIVGWSCSPEHLIQRLAVAWAASQYGDRVSRVSSPGEKAWGPGGILCYGTAPEGIGIMSTACWFSVQSQSHVSSKGEEVHSTSLWQNDEIMNSIWEWTCCCSRFWKLQSAALWSLRISDPCAPSPTTRPPSQDRACGARCVYGWLWFVFSKVRGWTTRSESIPAITSVWWPWSRDP